VSFPIEFIAFSQLNPDTGAFLSNVDELARLLNRSSAEIISLSTTNESNELSELEPELEVEVKVKVKVLSTSRPAGSPSAVREIAQSRDRWCAARRHTRW
jgi:hypothetical protein